MTGWVFCCGPDEWYSDLMITTPSAGLTYPVLRSSAAYDPTVAAHTTVHTLVSITITR